MTAMMKKTSSEAKDMISKVRRRCLFSVTPDASDLFYHFKVEMNENKNLPKIYNIH